MCDEEDVKTALTGPGGSKSDISDYDPTTSEGLTNLYFGPASAASEATGGPSASEAIEQGYGWQKEKVSGAYEDISGQTAADAAKEAAATQAGFQQQGLDYLMQTEAIPQELRQAGLQQLGGIAGLPGYEQYGNQQQLIDQAQLSPLYQSILGTGAAGQEAIARTASATGGLRGGGTASQLANYQQNLEQEALLESYNQQLGGIQGLAGLPSQAGQISQQYGQIGQTTAQGQIAAAQAQQQGTSNLFNLGVAAFSDVRMKDNVVEIGKTSNPGINRYKWDWKAESGKTGSEEGFLAQEVEKVYPDLVITLDDGFKRIFKDKIEERLSV